jgi:c-di-GMP-related signal transduction protein
MNEIIHTLQLSDEVSSAILRGEGKPGEVLRVVVAYERADWKTVDQSVLGLAEITSAWFRAVAWADGVISDVGDSIATAHPA